MGNQYVISFHTKGQYRDAEISKFSCGLRPNAGERWCIPLGEYPFENDGGLKRDDTEFVTVKIIEIGVVPFDLGRPSSPSILAYCQIISKESYLDWNFGNN